MIYLIIALLLGTFVAGVASTKGRNPFLWGVYGSIFFVVALPHALVMEARRSCRHCDATVRGDATVCGRCRHQILRNAKPSPQG